MAQMAFGLLSKRLLASVHDVGMATAAITIALLARYDLSALLTLQNATSWIVSFAVICAVTFQLFGLGRGMWRFASVTDLRAIILASTVAILAFLLFQFATTRLAELPRSAPVIAWFVLIVLLGAPRLAYRAFKDGGMVGVRPRDLEKANTAHVLILGDAGDADTVIRTYGLEHSRRYRVHGIVTLSAGNDGRGVRGIPIVGTVADLEPIAERLARGGIAIDALILAEPRRDGETIRTLAATAARLGLPLRRVTAASLTDAEPDLANITLDDLLGRPPVQLNLARTRALIENRVVLITGAGGSIGTEIVRQVAAQSPRRMILLDCSEYALYEVDRMLALEAPDVPRRAVIGDIRDADRVAALMQAERPSLVFHAAALKHVPLVEANVSAGVLTNVVGTRILADAAVANGVEAFVMISTDKAIRPSSVMGTTKRVAEAYCQALDTSGTATRFITVRFGNVLGSTGSVVPLFKRQIAAGGPITVTDPEMKRYFMTIKEATELVLQAAAHGVGRDDQRGRIFVLDMGEPMKIVDLARTMIALAGLRPDQDIAITFTGLRPGEKLFEELFDKDEPTVPAGVAGVFAAAARAQDLAILRQEIDALAKAARASEDQVVRSQLGKIVPHLSTVAAPTAERGTVVSLATARPAS